MKEKREILRSGMQNGLGQVHGDGRIWRAGSGMFLNPCCLEERGHGRSRVRILGLYCPSGNRIHHRWVLSEKTARR